MPATVGSKPPEPTRKKVSLEEKEVKEPRKTETIKAVHHESDDAPVQLAHPPTPPHTPHTPPTPHTPHTPQTPQDEPLKRPIPKKRVTDDRKTGAPVTERSPPKTKAQRAKGSTALNKVLEKTNSAGRKHPTSSRSSDRLPPPTRERGALSESRRAVAVRSKGKVKVEGAELKNLKKKKPWVAVVEKGSSATLNEKAVGVVEQESKEVKMEEMRPMNAGPNSCSFFEKLQQGMRAYFGVRSSFNPPSQDEKNQKKVTEGGIRTRARVGKGVKEDRKKTKPGKVVKNKKYSSESDLWYNRFRVNSNLGGQSNTSLKAKPKIFRQFRKLKRKKLYCPIKHCVRIQIPRKGYFYRSTVRFKAPGSAPSPQRMEYDIGPQSKSKVQIPRLASTSPKVPSLLQKRLKNNQKHDKLAPLEHTGSSSDHKVLAYHLAQGTTDNALPVTPLPTEPNKDKPNNQTKRSPKGKGKRVGAKRGTDGASEASSEGLISLGRIGARTPPPPDASLHTLMNCISSILGKDEGLYDLQITPVITGGGESLEGEFEPPRLQITEVVSGIEDLEASPAFQESTDGGDLGLAREDNIAKMLIGEIDLHVELQNYLREIECFNGVKSRTKNTLQCNLYDDWYPFEAMQNCSSDFETIEITSNSTFESATSVCTQQDGDTGKLHVFLDRKHDLGSMSEEHFDPRNAKVFISQTQVTEKVGDIRKIKSDNDHKKVQQESKLKSSIKRSYGKTSFEPSRSNEGKTWGLLSLRSDLSTESSVDSYEKIVPFGWHSSRSWDEKRSSRSCADSESLSGESVAGTSEAYRCREWAEKAGNDEEQVEETSSFEDLISMAIPQVQPKRRLWSPSLQELIEIYNNVLKHNKKIRNNSRTSVSRHISSHLFSFVNDELKEKGSKANLLLLSKNLKKKMKVPELWKPGRQRYDKSILEEYVTMFQEVLKSSLSIKQIARLNNVISGLQEYSEKNYDFIKNMNVKEKENVMKKVERSPKQEKISKLKDRAEKKSLSLPSKIPKKSLPTDRPIRSSRTSLRKYKVRRQKSQVTTAKAEEPLPVEEFTIIDLRSPTELESILQSCFTTKDMNGLQSRGPQDKVLVTVKLHGNQILVSKLTYFQNEEALSPGQSKESGTSELIIENVTKERAKSLGRKNGKSEKPKESLKLKMAKSEPKKVSKRRKAIAAAPEPKQNSHIDQDDKSFLKELEEFKILQPFEYDQTQLRVQHPIEAIIESSESKVSYNMETSEDDESRPQLQPPLKTNRNDTPLKEALFEALGENLNWKDLCCDFGWIDNSLARTKSYVMTREELKNQTDAQQPPKHADAFRSLTDIASKPRFRRKPRRKGKGKCFIVYPSILNMQRKAPLATKKSRKEFRQRSRPLCTLNPRMQSNNTVCASQGQELRKTSEESEVSLSDEEASEASCPKAPGKSEGALVDGCSVKLLYYEEDKPSGSASPKVSKTELSEQVVSEGQWSRGLSLAVEGMKGSSVVIQPSRNVSEDTIIHSVMIHSDSFLKKCYSSLALTEANLNSFLKTCSDLKFYPGRVSSSDKQQSPFVKFVLTPRQSAGAELPSSQVQVVDKRQATENAVAEEEEDINGKIPLLSIEKFIKKLSKGKKKVKPKAEAEERKKTPTSRMSQRKKVSSEQPRATDRKPYHECQKRRLNDKTRPAEKRPKTEDGKAKPETGGKAQAKVESTDSLHFLKKFLITLSEAMESFSREETERGAAVADVDPRAEGKRAEGRVEKATNTTSPVSVQTVRSAVTQTEEMVCMEERTEEMVCVEERTEEMVCVEEERTEEGCKREAEKRKPKPKKSKTVKIKIHCDERSKSKAGKSGQQRAKSPAAEEPLLGEKLGLLESLVMGEPEGGNLERQSSVYFDAVDHHSDGDNREEEFLTHWATVDLKNVSAGLLVKEKSEAEKCSGRSGGEVSAERVLEEILKSLQEEKIYHSLTLLDDLLGKVEGPENSDRLRNVLLLVSSKSKNLMISMEKSAWMKVLSLLEDIIQRFGNEDEKSQTTRKAFAEKIRTMSDSRLLDLQKYCSSLSLTNIGSNSRSIFCRIKDFLSRLKNRTGLQRDNIPSTVHPKHPLQHFRKQIRKQKSYIEFLLSAECSALSQEVLDVEGQVADKMRAFGNVLSCVSEG